jgi:hypothetical protein
MPLQPKRRTRSTTTSKLPHESESGRLLRRWLESDFGSSGFASHGAIVVDQAPRTGTRGAIAASRTIFSGDEALAVPRCAWLESAKGSTCELVERLDFELSRLPYSSHKAYLEFLPKLESHPVCLPHDMLTHSLSDTSALRTVEHFRASVDSSERALEYLALVLSRAFRFANGSLALVPWADALNHHSSAAISSEAELEEERANVAALSAAYDVHIGDELCDSYGGAAGKSTLFAQFGFVDPAAPDETVLHIDDREIHVSVDANKTLPQFDPPLQHMSKDSAAQQAEKLLSRLESDTSETESYFKAVRVSEARAARLALMHLK